MPKKWPVRWDLRTSQSHPIAIEWISHDLFDGEIGITLCPGKYQPVSWSGGWNRNLDTDILAIHEAGATKVVSLVEDVEMAILRVPGLGDAVISQGMDWYHLPFPDTTAPDNKWMEQFMLVRSQLIESIKEGEKIVIHCKGGLGRAGTVAAILLNELGLEMSDAISLVRKVRSSDCINPTQEEFLLSLE